MLMEASASGWKLRLPIGSIEAHAGYLGEPAREPLEDLLRTREILTAYRPAFVVGLDNEAVLAGSAAALF
jgi:hypothetical protein